MKKTIIGVIIVVVVVIVYLLIRSAPSTNPVDTSTDIATNTPLASTSVSVTPTPAVTDRTVAAIGQSLGGRDINAYHFGTGKTELLFVGGIHGGYEWNTVLVAYKLIDYLKTNPAVIPASVRVTVIPVMNPDGLNNVVGTTSANFSQADIPKTESKVIAGRYNGNKVDLNRNFDCDWQANGKWQNTTVSGGSAAFSEPESLAIKNYVLTNSPTAVFVWYSAAGGVYASNCHTGVLPETDTLTKKFAAASGYPAHASFDFYSTTGDMTNWLAKSGIPAVSILLTNHTDTEWNKNLAGINALFTYYNK